MPDRKTISVRVEEDYAEKLAHLADQQGESRSSYLRSILKNQLMTEEVGQDLRQDFRSDLRAIGGRGDAPLGDALESVWPRIGDSAARSRAREAVTDAAHVYVVGQGSSYAVGVWLAARLRAAGVGAHACHAGELPEAGIGGDEAVVAISRSGETAVTVDAVESLPADRVVGLTDSASSLADAAAHVIPQPAIDENVSNYATLSVVAAVATAQAVLFDDDPDLETINRRLDALSRFARIHFGDDDAVTGLATGSGFTRLVNELKAHDDLRGDPIVPAAGWHRGVGAELQQKAAEMLFIHGDTVDLASVRDRLVNVVVAGDGYLFVFLPDVGTAAYSAYHQVLFEHPESLDAILTEAPQVGGTPIACCTFNANGPVERKVKNRSVYGDAAVVDISAGAPDHSARELLAFYAGYLFIHALLNRRWAHDDALRTHVIKNVYDETLATYAE